MFLYYQEIEDLLTIINNNQAIAFGDFKEDFVTLKDKTLLLRYGVDFKKLYIKGEKTVFNLFNFAMLADSIRQVEKQNLSYENLLEFIMGGKYLPPSSRHLFMIECIKSQPFDEIKLLCDFETIRNDFINGISEKKILQNIISDIGHKTKNWDLHIILSHYHQIAWELSSVLEIRKWDTKKDYLVYKRVFERECKICIELYLTLGFGSEPKIFPLNELMANGSNIGKDKANFKPSVYPVHYGCTCTLHEKPEGFIWNPETQSFSTPDPNWKIVLKNRKPILVRIGNKEFYV